MKAIQLLYACLSASLQDNGLIIIMIQNKFKQLQNKLNSLAPNEEGESHKAKLRTLHQLLNKLHQRFDEENSLLDHKVTTLLDTLRKVDSAIKDTANDLHLEDNSWGTRAGKMEKSMRKTLERVEKEQKDSDRKLQGALEGYLVELTGFKGKAGSSCAASLRELRELEKDVDFLQRQAKRQAQLSRDIYRKVHSQFAAQMEDIAGSLAEEERQRQETDERLLEAVEKMYNSLSRAVGEGRRTRERQERDVVELLERVIEKLKHEISTD